MTRLRLALEASRPFALGADAETGFGADIGAGVGLSAPSRGLSGEVRARGLLTHEAGGMRERGLSGHLTFDPAPDSERGLSLQVAQTVGGPAAGGADALFARPTLAGLGAEPDGSATGRCLEARLGYGLGVFGDRFTVVPEFGAEITDSARGHRPTASLLTPSSACPAQQFVKQDDQSPRRLEARECDHATRTRLTHRTAVPRTAASRPESGRGCSSAC